jgi:hypothetical protein
MSFQLINGVHPINELDFIWIAMYSNATMDTEYDFDTQYKDVNKFYNIDKQNLIQFGLVGHGAKMYFDAINGVFDINMSRYTFEYHVNDTVINLNGLDLGYKDLITYKEAVSDIDNKGRPTQMTGGGFKGSIQQYNLGYKKKLSTPFGDLHFQCILSLPRNDVGFFDIKITSSSDLNGRLVFKRDGLEVDNIQAPLQSNVSGQINWTMK